MMKYPNLNEELVRYCQLMAAKGLVAGTEGNVTIGQVPLVPYGRPSSPKLAAALSPYCSKHNVFLLQNHGATAVGKDVREAYHRLEVVEAYAKMVWAAAALGGVKPLPRSAIDDLPSPTFP
jgi:L-fuculose-phosphate aldolase